MQRAAVVRMGGSGSCCTVFLCVFLFCVSSSEAQIPAGEWRLLQRNVGISAMHMQLLHNDQVVMFDRTDFGPSNISLAGGGCRFDAADVVLTTDCTAHSVAYAVKLNSFRPLTILTDTWCSSGAVLPNGTLLQTGGYNDGERAVRIINPCDDCDWLEIPTFLSVRRWYATDQILPDGRIIVVGGRRQFSYEFFPRSGYATTRRLIFLEETRDDGDENNLYPFLHLLPDGNLFLFANTRAVLFDYAQNRVLKEFPVITGEDPRNYPSSGSSVLLPLRLDAASAASAASAAADDDYPSSVEVMICGGARRGAFRRASAGEFVTALDTCGRLRVTDPNPMWEMERMPHPRVMGDMLLLPTADVLIINGAGAGTAGWELARDPVFTPVIYGPYEPPGTRFRSLHPSSIPRLYHSAAVIVSDGRVLVGGSNPHVFYNFTGVLFPTELSLESFSPPYLSPRYLPLRPSITFLSSSDLSYRQSFTVDFSVPATFAGRPISLTMLYPSFTTHALSMNQRLIVLKVTMFSSVSPSRLRAAAVTPPSPMIAPPGYYLLFVVHSGIPSVGVWVKIQ